MNKSNGLKEKLWVHSIIFFALIGVMQTAVWLAELIVEYKLNGVL